LIPLALDTSVAVPLVVQSHSAHADVTRWWHGRHGVLTHEMVGVHVIVAG